MLSWRLWQTLTEPSAHNPIFKLTYEKRLTIQESDPDARIFNRIILTIITILLLVVLMRIPEFLMVLFQIPLLAITFVIISPIFLPLIIILGSGYLVTRIITEIHKAKRQHTYDLLCASPEGSLHANWQFASGLLYRHSWFVLTKFTTNLIYKIGRITVVFLIGVTVILSVINTALGGLSQIQTLVAVGILLVLFYTNMQQSIIMGILMGLYTSSLQLSRRDASLIGLLTYSLLQLLPFVITLIAFIILDMVTITYPLTDFMLATVASLTIYALRELTIIWTWYRLKHNLNAMGDGTADIQSQRPYRTSIFSTSTP